MGKLTPEMVAEIRALYAEKKSYKLVADELGLDWKTVKAHVTKNGQNRGEKAASPSGEELATNQQQEHDRSHEQNRQQLTQSHLLRISEQEHPLPQQEENHLQKDREKSPFARALRLFEKGKTPVQAAIELDLSFGDVEQYYAQYGRLRRVARFFEICQGSPATLGAILKLHEKMLKADLDPSKTVQQLQYFGPIENASVTYHSLEENNQKLQAEINERKKKIADLDVSAGQLKAQSKTIQNNISALKGQLNALDNQYREKQTTLAQLKASESKISAQIKSAKITLNDLMVENGPIQTQIKEAAEQKAYEVLNNNELIFSICMIAAMSVVMRDPIGLINYYNRYPMQQGEDSAAYLHRCMPFLKEKLELLFNQARADFASKVSKTAVAEEYHS